MRAVKGSVEGTAGTCAGGICYWFNEGTSPACETPSPQGKTCGKTINASLPDYARTFWYRGAPQSEDKTQDCGNHPWCNPGRSGIRSPCGVAAGSDQFNPGGNSGYVPDGVAINTDGRKLPELKNQPKTVWRAGSTVNMSWSLNANRESDQLSL